MFTSLKSLRVLTLLVLCKLNFCKWNRISDCGAIFVYIYRYSNIPEVSNFKNKKAFHFEIRERFPSHASTKQFLYPQGKVTVFLAKRGQSLKGISWVENIKFHRGTFRMTGWMWLWRNAANIYRDIRHIYELWGHTLFKVCGALITVVSRWHLHELWSLHSSL